MSAVIYRTGCRTDVQVFIDARRALDRQMHVPTTIQVQVFGGTASLRGRVRWREERAEAEAAVRQVPGVLRVTNHIAVENAERPARAPSHN
jgi:osmotically-inducible protein OsmY